eukprot:3694341-Rhodomonas_salina.4
MSVPAHCIALGRLRALAPYRHALSSPCDDTSGIIKGHGHDSVAPLSTAKDKQKHTRKNRS